MYRVVFLVLLAGCAPVETDEPSLDVTDVDGDGVSEAAGDCDDGDATVSPLALDVFGDGADRNCDGADGEDRDGDGVANRETGGVDCDDSNAAVLPGAVDVCNGLDDDCNQVVDDGSDHMEFHADADGDGFGDPGRSVLVCAAPPGFVSDQTDCNDADKTAYPFANEACDGVDDDCDDVIDGPGTPGWLSWYLDADGDGFGAGVAVADGCTGPEGTVEGLGDCDDNNEARSPGLPEVCDGVDNDCDGLADPGPPVWFADVDGDGFGDGATATCGDAPAYGVLNGNDCNDDDANSHPGGVEVCFGADEDCDGLTDVDDPDVEAGIWYYDADGDGFGVTDSAIEACEAPEGTVDGGGDCDDHEELISPFADDSEGDGIDSNCDGVDGEA